MTALLRILFAIALLVSSSLSLAAMAAEGAIVHETHSIEHAHGEPEQGHDGLDCGMAVCCFMFAAAEPVGPADCSLASPQAAKSVPVLPDHPDPHEHPPQQG